VFLGKLQYPEAFFTHKLTLSRDLADAFPGGEIAQYFRADWIGAMIKEVRQNRDFSSRTLETARWTREQVKRQQAQAS
jgi:importin subunit beta-1